MLIAIFPSCSTAGDLKASLKKTLDVVIKLSCEPSGPFVCLAGEFLPGTFGLLFHITILDQEKSHSEGFCVVGVSPDPLTASSKAKAGILRSMSYFYLILQLWVLARSLWDSQ